MEMYKTDIIFLLAYSLRGLAITIFSVKNDFHQKFRLDKLVTPTE